MKMYRIAWKFAKDGSYICELCNTLLEITDIINNPKHHFNPGQLMKCSCGKSKVWANSIRYPKDLIKWCDGEEIPYSHDPEAWGFCNDEYCPYCWGVWSCLKNGYQKNGRYYDLFGCERCKDNQHSLAVDGTRLGEIDGQVYLANWYKTHQDMWRHMI
ncbi:MAG: hypothetical protein WC119_01070 [Synergistaceae bacterium]